jgi:hypothetical protein
MISKRNHNLLAVPQGVEVSPVGLKIRARLSYEQWEDIVGGLQRIHRSILWLIGDALCYGEQRWGEKYSQAIEATGYAVQTLMNAKWVSSQVQFSYRKENLSWTHHLQVAGLEPDEQRRFLQEAVDHDWGVQELRAAVRLFKEPEPKLDYQEPQDPPEIVPDLEPEFEEMEGVRSQSYYPEYPERIGDLAPPRVNIEADFIRLLGICRALRIAEKQGNGVEATRQRTAMDFFLAEIDRREERAAR